jgi:N-acetylneuraminic acid mutarotase
LPAASAYFVRLLELETVSSRLASRNYSAEMAKDKKSKSEGKKAKLAEKKAKQEKKGEKKEKVKKSKLEDSDGEDVDLDSLLAEYAKKQELFLKVSEAPCEPPQPRASATIIASPSNSSELFLFGGEYFNGAEAIFFNDLYVYNTDRDEWRAVTSQNTPLPRSGHAWCRGGNAGGIYLFGGEFSSPKQNTFYHYNTFYHLEPATREWTKLEPKGKSPPARSGHRMTYFKNYIILFGGFQDTSQQTKYLGDLWLYDTQKFVWYNPVLPPTSPKPDPRSSFSFLPHERGAVLYGGYSRVKATVAASKQAKGGSQGQRNVLKPVVHQDCFYLLITPPAADAPADAPPTVRWERRKKPMNTPNPPRAGATLAYHKGRGIMFGGVHDVEESEEGIDSEFFNTLFAWNIDRNRFFPLALRKSRAPKKVQAVERGGRRGRGKANEEELLRNLAALQAGQSLEDADEMDVDTKTPTPEEDATPAKPEKEVSMELPHPRFNAQLTVQDDVLYIYGGTYEKGDREYTFDEMYAIDLVKLDGVKEMFRREVENWVGSDDEDDDEEGDSDEDEDMDEEEEDKDGKLVHEMEIVADERLSEASTAVEEVEEDTKTKADDGLPYPRPFESRRDFFQRTSNEWQEVLMTSLRWKGIQPETLTVKEIKTKAFELSEEKWWDCREEITALEDEQEAAGIGEVVTLADRGESGGVGRRR